MTDTYTLPATAAGLALAFTLAESFRRQHYTTRLVEETYKGFELVTLHVTYPERLSRKERGL